MLSIVDNLPSQHSVNIKDLRGHFMVIISWELLYTPTCMCHHRERLMDMSTLSFDCAIHVSVSIIHSHQITRTSKQVDREQGGGEWYRERVKCQAISRQHWGSSSHGIYVNIHFHFLRVHTSLVWDSLSHKEVNWLQKPLDIRVLPLTRMT